MVVGSDIHLLAVLSRNWELNKIADVKELPDRFILGKISPQTLLTIMKDSQYMVEKPRA
jgi:hypothetical protein